MSRPFAAVLLAITVAACVPPAAHPTTTAQTEPTEAHCHDEAITGSNLMRTVCSRDPGDDVDRDQQMRDLQQPKQMNHDMK